jgi:RNA polymerase sigma-70 factor (ECF subfamily)
MQRRCKVEKDKFLMLYNRHAEKLFNFIRWTTADSIASRDILQNVFLRVWNCSGSPEDEKECCRWLFTIAKHACVDHFRSAARFSRFRKEYNLESGNDRVYPEKFSVWKEVARLPETERSILYLHLKIGYTFREIAEMLSLNESQVRVKAFRSLRKLREKITLEEHG